MPTCYRLTFMCC